MKHTHILFLISSCIIIGYGSFLLYKRFFVPEVKQYYTTTSPTKRTIYQTVYATGSLEIKDHIKIGSLVSGTIKKIFVKENSTVKKRPVACPY